MHTMAELKGAKSNQGVWRCKTLKIQSRKYREIRQLGWTPTNAEGSSLPFPIPFKHLPKSAHQASPDVGIIGIDGITVAANAHVVVTEWPFQGRDGR